MEKWFVINKGADFEKLGKEFGISPVTARLIRNREVIGEAAFERYLNGSLKDLYDPHLLKDADRLTDILKVKIEEQKPIRIIGDYDIDGVMSTYILYRGIKHCGGNVSTQIPDRMKDGYGINENLIDQAKRDGMDTILTCRFTSLFRINNLLLSQSRRRSPASMTLESSFFGWLPAVLRIIALILALTSRMLNGFVI